MRLFLIRHGETVDNVAGLYAGSRDSSLTNHGIQQARHLGDYIAKSRPRLTHIFASPLQRAFKTADALRSAQIAAVKKEPSSTSGGPHQDILDITIVSELVEQDFGFYEGKPFYARQRATSKTGREAHYDSHKNDPGFIDVESKDALNLRGDKFLNEHLIPLLVSGDQTEDYNVAVISHGIFLSHLWRRLLLRLPRKSLTIAPEVTSSKGPIVLEHLGGWSNTGFLELHIPRPVSDGSSVHMTATIEHASKSSIEVSHVKPQQNFSNGLNSLTGTATLPLAAQPPSMTSLAPVQASTTSSASPAQSLTTGVNHSQNNAFASYQTQNASTQPTINSETLVPSLAVRMDDADQLSDPPVRSLQGHTIHILVVNGQEHLRGLKRTRGGIGRARYDESQKTIEAFFKRAKKG